MTQPGCIFCSTLDRSMLHADAAMLLLSPAFWRTFLPGCFDESFVGWGDEEMEFLLRTALDVAPLRFVDGGVLHLMPLTNSGHQPAVLTPGTDEHAMYQANIQRRKKMAEERRPVRIAVYAPAKNEEHHVEAWAASAKDADAIVLVDTGSTDDTVTIAEGVYGVTVHQIAVSPWRFDVGRNAALALLPADIDVAVPLDLDERLQPGWRESLEAAWRAGGRQFTFDYRWAPEVSFRYDRIHARHGYQWKGAAHEYPSGPGPKVDTDVRIVHERDQNKDRSQYLTLLEMGWQEDPNPRNTYYLAREYFYENDWVKSRDMFQRYLRMPEAIYDQERSEACRHMAKMVYEQYQESWLLRACYEAPQRREVWADLAVWYRDHGYPKTAAGVAARLLSITDKTPNNSFRVEQWAWDDAAFTQMLAL